MPHNGVKARGNIGAVVAADKTAGAEIGADQRIGRTRRVGHFLQKLKRGLDTGGGSHWLLAEFARRRVDWNIQIFQQQIFVG